MRRPSRGILGGMSHPAPPSSEDVPASLAAWIGSHESRAPASARHVHVAQVGELRTKPGGRWIPFRATQRLAIDQVSFAWRAHLRVAHVVPLLVTDAFDGRRGSGSVRLAGLVPLARVAGEAIDQAQIQRYLAELAWNPLALLRVPALRRGEGEDGSLRVGWGPAAAHVDLFVDSEGRIVRTFTRTRPRDGGPPEPWEGRYVGYGDVGGYVVPVEAEVTWHTPEGPFPCWRGRITRYELT